MDTLPPPAAPQELRAEEPQAAPRPARRRRPWALITLGALALIVAAIVLFWNWDWFLPIVDARASAALGRRVTAQHLRVALGRVTRVTLQGVRVDNPNGFAPGDPPFVTVRSLTVDVDVMQYWHHSTIVLPRIAVDQPIVEALAEPNGATNFAIKPPPAKPDAKPAAPPQIGDLVITDGHAHVVDPKFRSNFRLDIATRAASGREAEAIVIDAKGTYANAPITGRFVGGALLTLRDSAHPYPIDLRVANGLTHASLIGTVQNPLNFAGANLTLSAAGPDMSLLFPLTGVPIPATPPYSVSGRVDYAGKRVRVTDFHGRVGNSDIEGTITEDPGIGGKPDVTMDLVSQRVDLADLGGFIGTTPGKASEPGQTVAQKREHAADAQKKTLLPDTKINLPKIRAANVHLRYRGEHIENKYVPFDKFLMALDLVDGRITLHPLDFTVGRGDVASNIDLAPGADDIVHARADARFRHIDISRIMAAAHAFNGNGILGGEAEINAEGNSLATMMAQGNGELKLVLQSNGNLSALLVDLSGLEFGNALLSALGIPNRAKIECFVTDLPMHQGVVSTKALLLDTDEARISGSGTIDFRNQTLDYALTTRSKHFSIGSLPGPIDITGPLGSPSIRPGAEVVARAGAAAGLGVLLTPLGALLPTIQFGVGEDGACGQALTEVRQPLKAPPPRLRHARR